MNYDFGSENNTMGIERSVRFASASPPWTAVRDVLAARKLTFDICMIDGELSFPNEQPHETWRELRFRTPQGMITVRREADRLFFVTWGNADIALLQQRDDLARAFADSGDGLIEDSMVP